MGDDEIRQELKKVGVFGGGLGSNAWAHALSIPPTPTPHPQAWRALDTDQSGHISKTEFLEYFRHFAKMHDEL